MKKFANATILGTLLLLCWISAGWAACALTSLTFKDSAGVTQTLCFGGASGAFIPVYNIVDSTGANILGVNASGQLTIANTAFTANAGTNLNTSALALEAGGNLAQHTTDFGAPGATACATDTSSCNFNQLFQRIAQRLTTVNTTLGTPMQATGGSVTANAGTNLNTSLLALASNQSTLKAGSTPSVAGDTSSVVQINPSQPNLTTPLNVSVTSGSVTANAGTNLNTSALALSANQSTLKAASTQSVAGDTSSVVQINPNQPNLTTPLNVSIAQIAGTAVVGDPCQIQTAHYTPISVTSATTSVIVTGVSAKKTYVCALSLATGLANNVAVIEGTTSTTCGTSAAGVIGGATAANGLNFAANGGLTFGSGVASLAATATANDDLCIITSSAGPLAGNIKWVQQ